MMKAIINNNLIAFVEIYIAQTTNRTERVFFHNISIWIKKVKHLQWIIS